MPVVVLFLHISLPNDYLTEKCTYKKVRVLVFEMFIKTLLLYGCCT